MDHLYGYKQQICLQSHRHFNRSRKNLVMSVGFLQTEATSLRSVFAVIMPTGGSVVRQRFARLISFKYTQTGRRRDFLGDFWWRPSDI